MWAGRGLASFPPGLLSKLRLVPAHLAIWKKSRHISSIWPSKCPAMIFFPIRSLIGSIDLIIYALRDCIAVLELFYMALVFFRKLAPKYLKLGYCFLCKGQISSESFWTKSRTMANGSEVNTFNPSNLQKDHCSEEGHSTNPFIFNSPNCYLCRICRTLWESGAALWGVLTQFDTLEQAVKSLARHQPVSRDNLLTILA